MSRDLSVAILLLKRGSPVPSDTAARLLAQGYDLGALEARYAR